MFSKISYLIEHFKGLLQFFILKDRALLDACSPPLYKTEGSVSIVVGCLEDSLYFFPDAFVVHLRAKDNFVSLEHFVLADRAIVVLIDVVESRLKFFHLVSSRELAHDVSQSSLLQLSRLLET
jgi:hypothetical protein